MEPPPSPSPPLNIRERISYYIGNELDIVHQTNAILESIAHQNDRLSESHILEDITGRIGTIVKNLEAQYRTQGYQQYNRMDIVNFLGNTLILESHLESLGVQYSNILQRVHEFHFRSEQTVPQQQQQDVYEPINFEILSLPEDFQLNPKDLSDIQALLNSVSQVEQRDVPPLLPQVKDVTQTITFQKQDVHTRTPLLHQQQQQQPRVRISSPQLSIIEQDNANDNVDDNDERFFKELPSSPIDSVDEDNDIHIDDMSITRPESMIENPLVSIQEENIHLYDYQHDDENDDDEEKEDRDDENPLLLFNE